MTPEPLEFDAVSLTTALERSGYCHCSPETPKRLLDQFMEQHGLSVVPGEWQFTITLVPATGVRGSGTDWEALRKANADKRLKAAAAKKRRQA